MAFLNLYPQLVKVLVKLLACIRDRFCASLRADPLVRVDGSPGSSIRPISGYSDSEKYGSLKVLS